MLKFNESIDSVILFTLKGAYMVFFCFQSDIFFLSHPLSALFFGALLYEKTLKGIVFTNKITIFAASFYNSGFMASLTWPVASLTWPYGLV